MNCPMKRDIRLERFYPHPQDLVWRAITDSEYMKQWMKMESNFKPEVGHKFELHDISGNWGGVLYCEVILVDAPSQLSYRFQGGFMKHETIVTWTLMPEAHGTRLKLDHTGFTGLTDIAISGLTSLGWRWMLGILSKTLTTMQAQ